MRLPRLGGTVLACTAVHPIRLPVETVDERHPHRWRQPEPTRNHPLAVDPVLHRPRRHLPAVQLVPIDGSEHDPPRLPAQPRHSPRLRHHQQRVLGPRHRGFGSDDLACLRHRDTHPPRPRRSSPDTPTTPRSSPTTHGPRSASHPRCAPPTPRHPGRTRPPARQLVPTPPCTPSPPAPALPPGGRSRRRSSDRPRTERPRRAPRPTAPTTASRPSSRTTERMRLEGGSSRQTLEASHHSTERTFDRARPKPTGRSTPCRSDRPPGPPISEGRAAGQRAHAMASCSAAVTDSFHFAFTATCRATKRQRYDRCGGQPRRGVAVALARVRGTVDREQVERVVGERAATSGAPLRRTLLPRVRQRDHVVDLHRLRLGLAEHEPPSGVGIVEHPGHHDAVVRPRPPLPPAEVAVQHVVTGVAAVAVDVGPRRRRTAPASTRSSVRVPSRSSVTSTSSARRRRGRLPTSPMNPNATRATHQDRERATHLRRSRSRRRR